jgi:cobalt/nickel transport system ATP-binding protein
VEEDVAFGPINQGLSEDEVKARVAEGMQLTGLAGFEERVPHHLSLGEKKRVAMAGLLAMSPDILLLDEPTSNLDPQGRRDLINILRGRKETIIIATHDLGTAFELAERVIVLKKRIIFDGSFRDLILREDTLKEARLELPSFSRLMMSWRTSEGKDFLPPMTVEEALEVLKRRD